MGSGHRVGIHLEKVPCYAGTKLTVTGLSFGNPFGTPQVREREQIKYSSFDLFSRPVQKHTSVELYTILHKTTIQIVPSRTLLQTTKLIVTHNTNHHTTESMKRK